MKRIALLLPAAASAATAAAAAALIATGGLGPIRIAPEHAHLNLLGWAFLGVMWLTMLRNPVLFAHRGAVAAQGALSGLPTLLFPLGISLARDGDTGVLTALTLLWCAGAVLFLARLIGLLAQRDEGAIPAA